MFALQRSAALGGQVALPLTDGADEQALLGAELADSRAGLVPDEPARVRPVTGSGLGGERAGCTHTIRNPPGRPTEAQGGDQLRLESLSAPAISTAAPGP